MAQTAHSSPENRRYNNEVLLLDSLYEFHPDLFDSLSPEEMHAIKCYYLTGQDVPDNIFEYRSIIIKNNPEIEGQAQTAFAKICQLAGVQSVKRT